jgi:hypothetical protein
MPMFEKRCCDTCKHYQPTINWPHTVCCKRYPPTLILRRRLLVLSKVRAYYPITLPTDCCGEWQAKGG